ncbi:2-keto-4-pentenoate hydratase [Actimicrobium antarcticum]
MPVQPDRIISAATQLFTRRRSREQGPVLQDACRPTDIASALAIQAAVTRLLGAEIGGWKCATPAAGQVVLAPIYQTSIHATNPCPLLVRGSMAQVEPELAFVLGCDLPPREQPYTPADIDAAIVRTHLSLELLDSRYLDHRAVSFLDNLADGLVNQGLFLGPQIDPAGECGTLALQIGSTNETLAGHHPAGSPRLPLYWLAEYLRSQGQGLRAGQVVITGSYAGCIPLPIGQDVAIRYGELGTLTVCFQSDA